MKNLTLVFAVILVVCSARGEATDKAGTGEMGAEAIVEWVIDHEGTRVVLACAQVPAMADGARAAVVDAWRTSGAATAIDGSPTTDAWPSKHRFCDHGAAEHVANLQPHNGYHRNEHVFHGMPGQDLPLCQALGSGGGDVVLPQHFQKVCSDQPGNHP